MNFTNRRRRQLPNGFRLRDPLTWWRHAVMRDLDNEDRERFIRALTAASMVHLSVEEAQRGITHPEEALRIAVRLYPPQRSKGAQWDLAMSWFVVAHIGGQEVASLAIADSVRELLAQSEGPSWLPTPTTEELAKLRRRMHLWFNEFQVSLLFKEPRKHLGPLLEPTASPILARYTLTPVRSIPTDGRHGRDIAKRYSALTQPLPVLPTPLSPDHLELLLMRDVPWCGDVISAICDDLRLQALGNWPIARFRPTLLLGPPGIGKTRLAQRIAKHLGLPFRFVACSAARSFDLGGISRVYESTQPGLGPRLMQESGYANAVILLDEVDKTSIPHGERSLFDILLPMLEPETASSVPDECLCTTINLSAISWLLTANDAAHLPAPFLDRVRVIDMKRPEAVYLPGIIDGIVADLAAYHGCVPEALPTLSEQSLTYLAEAYQDGASIRAIKRSIASAISSQLRTAPTH